MDLLGITVGVLVLLFFLLLNPALRPLAAVALVVVGAMMLGYGVLLFFDGSPEDFFVLAVIFSIVGLFRCARGRSSSTKPSVALFDPRFERREVGRAADVRVHLSPPLLLDHDDEARRSACPEQKLGHAAAWALRRTRRSRVRSAAHVQHRLENRC